MAEGKLLLKGDFGLGQVVTGKVRLVDYKNPSSYGSVQPGDIMVCERTVPDNEQAMKVAGATVTMAGGKTSHTMFTAKIYGYTCVVGATDAMGILHDGQMVVVDGPGAAVYEATGGAAAPSGGESLADKMAKMAASQGKTLSPEFLEKLKKRGM